jgi:hypothetical protein
MCLESIHCATNEFSERIIIGARLLNVLASDRNFVLQVASKGQFERTTFRDEVLNIIGLVELIKILRKFALLCTA